MSDQTQKCIRCYRVLPIQKFYSHGITGRALRTCDECRGYQVVKREKRKCPGLPKSWGYGKCKDYADAHYRCPTCRKIWNDRHEVVEGRMGEADFGGGFHNSGWKR